MDDLAPIKELTSEEIDVLVDLLVSNVPKSNSDYGLICGQFYHLGMLCNSGAEAMRDGIQEANLDLWTVWSYQNLIAEKFMERTGYRNEPIHPERNGFLNRCYQQWMGFLERIFVDEKETDAPLAWTIDN
ncbi:hypothetical protein HYV87_03415 [Candidatus Woesearchaeota archaeon]|nr:hypothetical protein [Candidatus Woesearchaeota archaeon]